MSSTQQDIIDLKLRALELKKAGDVEGAKALLARARELEFQDVSADSLDDPAVLKRLAVTLKKKGDVDGARAALSKAKRLESGEAAEAAGGGGAAEREGRREAAHQPAEVEEAPQAVPTAAPTGGTNSPSGTDDHAESIAVVAGEVSSDEQMDVDDAPVTFSDEEMLDIDMMREFKLSGMDVPSEEDYQAKILACKKAAVRLKQNGDIEKAKAALGRAKQFEVAKTRLAECDGSDDELNAEDEAWLMNELNQEDSAVFDELFGDENALDLDDLDDMDAEMLKVMIDSGMEVPTHEEVMESAKDKKALALGLKQAGNLVGAKAALAESKRLQSRAERLKELLDEIAAGGDDSMHEGDIDDLEKLLVLSENKKKEQPIKPAEPAVPAKSAEELKQEVIQLRSANRIKEATALFKVYKQALAREEEAAEVEHRKEIISSLNDEIEVAKKQERLFLFYERFVDGEAGTAQLREWREYARKCDEAAGMVQTNGSGSVDLARAEAGGSLLQIHNDDVDFVGGAYDDTDERMEVAILSISEIQANKTYKRMVKDAKKQSPDGNVNVALNIRVDVVIQLPPNEKDTDEHINLSFTPSSPNSSNVEFEFDASQFVCLPRGKSPYAKTIHRRMCRKKLLISVFHDPPRVEKSSGWFRTRKQPDEEKKPVLLGKLIFELREFWAGNVIAGDFPLTDSARKEVGGKMRLGLRTGAPYDPQLKDEGSTQSETVDIRPFSAMSLLPAT